MKYIHLFTFRSSTKWASYSIKSENRILPYTQFKKLAEEQNINLSNTILINQSTFLNEENN